ncbi:MAG: ABC transporter ATP-binding protein [bacterium]|nr:ABC transporter ATP-binding protein [bacterium]
MSALTLTGVSKTLHHKKIIEGINLDVHEGEILSIVGPSGSGKSILLKTMAGLIKPDHGEIKLSRDDGDDISFVFQGYALLPWLTAYKNIELALIAKNVPVAERKTKTSSMLKALGLEKYPHLRPHDLSSGTQQRIGIARALVSDPRIIFMDEPFSEVDSVTADILRDTLLEIWHERRPTIVIVSHIIEEAIELADRIVIMSPQPGKIERIIKNTLPRPRNRRSHEFFEMEDQIYRILKP